VRGKCAGNDHVTAGKGAGKQDIVRRERKKWRHLKLPEEQPDGVNKRPEIVVTINFGAGVEANISKYLSEFLAIRRQTSKQYTYVVIL